MTFNYKSFLAALFLFIIEVLIAKFITQPFIRFWLGDVIVVMLMYYFIKAFFNATPVAIGVAVLIFSFVIEFLQLTNLLDLLHLRNHRIANLILGNTFSVSDLVAYVVGILIVVIWERQFQKEVA